MSSYLRPLRPGALIFFTVTLADRRSRLLVDEVERLRTAVAVTRHERPFGIEAWVMLPDHLHCIWRLPEGDADYGTWWRLIKARFSRGVAMGARRESHMRRQERGVWQRRFWGEERPENGPVDHFQRRTGEAPAAKPIISVTKTISRGICGIVGGTR